MNGGPLDALRRHIDELFAARAAHYCIHHASIRASRHKSERGLGKSRCPLKRSSQEENGGYIHATWGRKLLGFPKGYLAVLNTPKSTWASPRRPPRDSDSITQAWQITKKDPW